MNSYGPESMDLRDPSLQDAQPSEMPVPEENMGGMESESDLMDFPTPGPIILISPKNTIMPDTEFTILEDPQLDIDSKITNFGTCEVTLAQDPENPYSVS